MVKTMPHVCCSVAYYCIDVSVHRPLSAFKINYIFKTDGRYASAITSPNSKTLKTLVHKQCTVRNNHAANDVSRMVTYSEFLRFEYR